MNRIAASILVAGMTACRKHENAAARSEVTATPPPVDTSVVASPAPSASVAVAASASAGPTTADSVQQLGMIGLLNAGAGADPNAPTAPWGREDALGDSGVGVGAGDAERGEGIGLGNIGTIGHGAGTGTGQGFGSGHGRLGGAHPPPRIRQGQTTVNGHLPPEVIQRIVRQNFGRFRLCYENGLRADPKLAGTVATKFVINTQGNVTTTTRDPSTTLTDAGVVSCITRAFANLTFPQPEGGIVIVTYPLILDPPETR